ISSVMATVCARAASRSGAGITVAWATPETDSHYTPRLQSSFISGRPVKRLQPIQRRLQDNGCRHLVDDLPPALAATIRIDQHALGGHGRPALIPKQDR